MKEGSEKLNRVWLTLGGGGGGEHAHHDDGEGCAGRLQGFCRLAQGQPLLHAARPFPAAGPALASRTVQAAAKREDARRACCAGSLSRGALRSSRDG